MIKYFKLSLLVLIAAPAQAQAPIEDSIETRIIETRCGFSEIKERELMVPIGANFTKMIEGRLPGVQATNGGGQPGSLSSLLIRGDGTNTGNNQPLIVLDGAPYFGDYNAINPNDIYTVTILKDAVATMRYGSMGANGIVDIKTKKGKSFGKSKLAISASTGIVTRGLSDYKTIKGEKDYYELSWEAYKNGLIADGFSDAEARNAASGIPNNYGVAGQLGYNSYNVADSSLIDPLTGKLNPNAQLKYSDGNWAKAMQRKGLRQEYHAAFSGGGSKGNYYLSAGYLNEEGYVNASDYERFTAKFNGEIKPLPWLKGGIYLSGSIGNQNYIPLTDNSNNPFNASRNTAPIYPVHYYDASGQKVKDPLTGNDKYDWGDTVNMPNSSMSNRRTNPGQNAVGSLGLDKFLNKDKNWTASPFIEATLLKQIKIRTQLNYNTYANNLLEATHPIYGLGFRDSGRTFESSDEIYNNVIVQTLNWEKSLGKHNFDVLVGYEFYKNKIESYSSSQVGNYPALSNSRFIFERGQESHFAIANYNFANKYFVNLSARKDNFSGYILEPSLFNNWAIGAAWAMHEERFLQDFSFINTLKLKATIGKINDLFPYKTYNANDVYTTHTNFGAEIGLFNNRLRINTDYFIKTNSGLAISTFMSTAQMWVHYYGLEIQNKGIELQIATEIIRKSPTNWTTTLNLTSYKNEITNMPDRLNYMIRGKNIWQKGGSIYDFYLIESAGVDPTNGDQLYYRTTPSGEREKTNEYYDLQSTDRKVIGSALPKLFGSLINDIEYKNFTFSFMFTFGLGGKYYDGIYQELMDADQLGKNYSEDILDRWTPENTNTNVPRIETYNPVMAQTSSRFLVDASYLNWRNASLSYNFSESKLKKIKLSSLKVYIAGDNLLLFSARKGMDPQAVFNNNPGYVYNPARTLILGLKVGI